MTTLKPKIEITSAPLTIHLGIVVSRNVDDLEAMTAAQAIHDTLADKLVCVSTFRTAKCLAAVTPAYKHDLPVLTLPKHTSRIWWLNNINMVAVIDGEWDDPFIDWVFDEFNAGEFSYPFIHCRRTNNYAIEIL